MLRSKKRAFGPKHRLKLTHAFDLFRYPKSGASRDNSLYTSEASLVHPPDVSPLRFGLVANQRDRQVNRIDNDWRLAGSLLRGLHDSPGSGATVESSNTKTLVAKMQPSFFR